MITKRKLAIAICSANVAMPALAQDDTQPRVMEEITVTATKRESSAQDIPYNITAIGADELSQSGIRDFSKLARSLPGLNLSDVGRSKTGISNGIIVRGLNVTGSAQEDFANITDPVISVYLGETPLFANLELRDMEQVEVLRGPQATLYGSGSLGGTLKYVPAKPDIDELYGSVSAKVSATDESDDFNGDIEATLNLPISDVLAFRGTLAQVENAGYVDSDFIEELDENGQPTGVTRTVEDLNDESIQMARGTLRFAPSDATDIQLMLNYQKDDIGGSAATAEGLNGYESGTKVLEEFERETNIGSLVIRQDLGFAELTSASSITKNDAESVYDQSYNYGYSSFWTFYAGVPREVVTGVKTYESKATTQELRLASTGDSNISWLVGLYYNDVEFDAEAYDFIAGVDAFYGIVNPQEPDLGYSNLQTTEFEDTAIFGEISFNLTDAWQVTFGARYFDQSFFSAQEITLPPCGVFCGDGPTGFSSAAGEEDFSDTLFKFNTSYDFSDATKLYFTVSEGFRHGGANGVPVDDFSTAAIEGGVFSEHPDYLFFDPDQTLNYEVGLKGYALNSRARYSMALFYIEWKDPLLIMQTPNGGFPVMFNGEEATTTGLEFELQYNLTDNFTAKLGYSYTDAELSKDFLIPNAGGGEESFLTGGFEGDPLPGVPEHTVNLVFDYTKSMNFGADLIARLSFSYKDAFVTGFDEPSFLAETGYDEIGSSTLTDASVGLQFDKWSASIFIDNLTNEDSITASDGDLRYNGTKPGLQYSVDLGDQEYRVRPRTIGVGLNYQF